jgi:6-phosphofructokinase
MKNSTLKYVLAAGVVLAAVLIIVGIIGAAKGDIIYCVPMIFGFGAAIAIVCEYIYIIMSESKLADKKDSASEFSDKEQ